MSCCARRSDVADASRDPVKRQTMVKPAATSIRLSIPKATSATEPAAIPAESATANSITCQAFPPHASRRALRWSPALSAGKATLLTLKGYVVKLVPEELRLFVVLEHVEEDDEAEHRGRRACGDRHRDREPRQPAR